MVFLFNHSYQYLFIIMRTYQAEILDPMTPSRKIFQILRVNRCCYNLHVEHLLKAFVLID